MIGANAGIGVAVANFFPTIGLSTLYGGASNKIGNVVKDSASLWNIAANLSGPDLPGRQAARVVLRAEGVLGRDDRELPRRRSSQAFREVADALAAQDRLAEQRKAQEAQVVALREAMRLSLARYDTGLTNYIEVLDAEELLYPAESALAQTRRDQLVAVVNLYKALGGGWETPGEQVAAR